MHTGLHSSNVQMRHTMERIKYLFTHYYYLPIPLWNAQYLSLLILSSLSVMTVLAFLFYLVRPIYFSRHPRSTIVCIRLTPFCQFCLVGKCCITEALSMFSVCSAPIKSKFLELSPVCILWLYDPLACQCLTNMVSASSYGSPT